MPTETAAGETRLLHSGVEQRRILRLALGTAVSLWISQAVGWSLSYLAPVVTLFLLAMPVPRPPPKFFVVVVVAISVSVYGSFVFLPLLLHQTMVGVLLLALALFHSFYFTARGGPAAVGTLITIGLTITVAVGSVSVDALLGVASGLTLGASVGAVVALLAHLIMPDPPMPLDKPASSANQAASISLSVARRSATRSLGIVLPIAVWFLLSSTSASNVAVMIKVAAMGQEASAQAARDAARSLIASTLAGGAGAVIAWETLRVWPSLLLYTLLVGLAGLLFGQRIFKGAGLQKNGAIWSYGFLTMLVILAPAVLDGDFGSGAGARFYDRLFMFLWATVYGVAAVYVFEALWPGNRSRQPQVDSI